MAYATIELEIDAGIATVALNRPPVNAQNREMRGELMDVFDALSDMSDVRCVVLTAKGRLFSAGADLTDRPAESPGAHWRHNRLVRDCFNAVADCRKPVIAAVNGPAIGAGFALVTSADIWVAAKNAYFTMPEINLGLAGGTAMLQSLFGKSRANRMFMTGMKVDADEMYRLGLVEASLPPEELMPYAMGLAREIADKAPLATQFAKEASQITSLMPEREGYRLEQNYTVMLSKTHDSKEARAAFLEKRAPNFKAC